MPDIETAIERIKDKYTFAEFLYVILSYEYLAEDIVALCDVNDEEEDTC